MFYACLALVPSWANDFNSYHPFDQLWVLKNGDKSECPDKIRLRYENVLGGHYVAFYSNHRLTSRQLYSIGKETKQRHLIITGLEQEGNLSQIVISTYLRNSPSLKTLKSHLSDRVLIHQMRFQYDYPVLSFVQITKVPSVEQYCDYEVTSEQQQKLIPPGQCQLFMDGHQLSQSQAFFKSTGPGQHACHIKHKILIEDVVHGVYSIKRYYVDPVIEGRASYPLNHSDTYHLSYQVHVVHSPIGGGDGQSQIKVHSEEMIFYPAAQKEIKLHDWSDHHHISLQIK